MPRKRVNPLPPWPIRIIAIDGGNSTGLSVWENGSFVCSHTLNPWKVEQSPIAELPPQDRVLYVSEVFAYHSVANGQKNGTTIGWLLAKLGYRPDIDKLLWVRPHKWRGEAYASRKVLSRDAAKKKAVSLCEEEGLSVASDDEAEAVLIGKWAMSSLEVLGVWPKLESRKWLKE